jgi:hypothetical protein
MGPAFLDIANNRDVATMRPTDSINGFSPTFTYHREMPGDYRISLIPLNDR